MTRRLISVLMTALACSAVPLSTAQSSQPQAQNVTLGQFKKEETDKIIVQAMRGKNIKRSSITVSPTKVQEYWEKHRAEFMSKEQVKLRMIMIPTHGSDAAQQKTLAEEIL